MKRWVKEGGSAEMGYLKEYPFKIRWVREGGREATGWLKAKEK